MRNPVIAIRGSEALPGACLVAASAAAFSTAGFFTMRVQVDTWTILFWRGLFGGLFIGGCIVVRQRRCALHAFCGIGIPGLLAGACSTLATICFIHALRLSTVAEVTVIYATSPFLAAAAAWIWSRERQDCTTLLASAAAMAGVLIMFHAAWNGTRMAGDLLAFVMALLMAIMMVIIRRNRQTSMLPAACLSALGCAVVAFPFAHPAQVSGIDLLWLALFGTTQFGLGLLLLTLGTRLLPPAQAALIANLELPLAPLWVWLAFGQLAPRATWIGGAVVIAAVLFDLTISNHRTTSPNQSKRAPSPPPGAERAGVRWGIPE